MSSFSPTDFDNSVIVITGGAGFVGSNLIRYLLANSNPQAVVVIDNYLSSDPDNLPVDPRLHILVGSAADPRVLGRLPQGIDYVFHLACFHGNQSSIHDPLADHDNNSFPSLVFFDFLSKISGIKKVVYSAAGCAVAEKTFDEPAATSEDAPVSLFHDSPYSISKLIGEMYGNYYYSRHRLPFVKARFQNVYGPGEVLGAGQWRGTQHSVWRNVIPTFIWKCLENEDIPLENDGMATRDFIFVDDLVVGLSRAAILGQPSEAYNLGSGYETSIGELASSIVRLSGSESKLLNVGTTRTWDRSGRRFADTSKSQREIGFVTETHLEAGLATTIQWSSENRERIRASIEKHSIQASM